MYIHPTPQKKHSSSVIPMNNDGYYGSLDIKCLMCCCSFFRNPMSQHVHTTFGGFLYPPANFLYKMVVHVLQTKPFFIDNFCRFLGFQNLYSTSPPFYFFGPVGRHFIESIYVGRHSIEKTWPHHSIENPPECQICMQRPFYRETTFCIILINFKVEK